MIRSAGSALRWLRGHVIGAYLALDRVRQDGGVLDRAIAPLQRRRATFFCDPGDPHSYLLAQKLPALAALHGLETDLIVVSPAAAEVRPGGAQHDAWAMRDALLLSRWYELDFPADPVLPPPALVARVQAVLMRPRAAGAQLAAMRALGDALWRGDADRLHALEAELGAVPAGEVAGRLRAGDTLLRVHGHYQGSMLRYRGIWYWGVDRLAHLEARLRRGGGPKDHAGPGDHVGRDTWPDSELVPMRPVSERPPVTGHVAGRVAGRVDGLIAYVSVRSPYSYIGLVRAARIAEEQGVTLDVRPLLPLRMRGVAVPRVKELYIARDASREAARHGVPFGRICDPLGPGVERCMAVFSYAAGEGKAVAYLCSVGSAVWAEGLDLTSDRDLATVVERAGLDWGRARAALADTSWRELTARHRAELDALGLWGVPSFCLGELAVWGQDRLPILEDILRRQPRA
jgi:2-hydroxychromene-2-carboxylate isomerase